MRESIGVSSSKLNTGQPTASRRVLLLIFAIAVVALFLIANRGAYRAFFSDDDFDHTANARESELLFYAGALFKLNTATNQIFRPAADFYYFFLVRLAGLHFPAYIATTHALHLLNVALVWTLARALKAAPLGACAAALLFAFHIGVFELYWQPMYIYDLLCGTFILGSLLFYVRGQVILSLICFWLALKSKELAILLPFVLAAYEWWLNRNEPHPKNWKRLIPFFAVSMVIGIQALLFNTHREGDYALRFTPATVWMCARFYASKLVLAPGIFGLAAIPILLLPFPFKNPVVRFGVFTFVAFIAMMLILPGRLYGAYLYVPLIGLAIALSAVTRPLWLALFFAAWIPWNYYNLRLDRKTELAASDERRAWFQPVAKFTTAHPDIDTFVYDGEPDTLASWGVSGALRDLRPPLAPIQVVPVEAPDIAASLAKPQVAVLHWDRQRRELRILRRDVDLPYVRLNSLTPLWQLGEGWIDSGETFRWIAPHATARLARPPGAQMFEVVVYVPGVYIDALHQGRLDVSLNHNKIGSAVLNKPEPETFRFPLAPTPEGPVEVEFDVSPSLKDPGGTTKLFGVPIAAFGFIQ